MREVHVLPEAAGAHILDRNCWCGPTVATVDRTSVRTPGRPGEPTVTHNPDAT